MADIRKGIFNKPIKTGGRIIENDVWSFSMVVDIHTLYVHSQVGQSTEEKDDFAMEREALKDVLGSQAHLLKPGTLNLHLQQKLQVEDKPYPQQHSYPLHHSYAPQGAHAPHHGEEPQRAFANEQLSLTRLKEQLQQGSSDENIDRAVVTSQLPRTCNNEDSENCRTMVILPATKGVNVALELQKATAITKSWTSCAAHKYVPLQYNLFAFSFLFEILRAGNTLLLHTVTCIKRESNQKDLILKC